jgi:N-acetylmuramoyl-L-alanine amidase
VLKLATAVIALVGLCGAASAGGKRQVVIDPGHGGSNAGAKGPGLHEKQLTLAIATQVGDRLRARGVDVHFTRTGDRTLTLRQRVAVADRLDADVFVSIHANASAERTQRGFETFVLSARGIDIDGRALRSDTRTRPGVDPTSPQSSVTSSVALPAQGPDPPRASAITPARRGSSHDRGVRQDSHHVLLGAKMPAILVEVGFLDHPVEGRELATPAVQSKIADAIAEAISDQLAD